MGYTHYCVEEFDGVRSGAVVRRGLQILMRAQSESGFVETPNEEGEGNRPDCALLAGVVLAENYAFLGTPWMEEPAARTAHHVFGPRGAASSPNRSWLVGYRALAAVFELQPDRKRFPEDDSDGREDALPGSFIARLVQLRRLPSRPPDRFILRGLDRLRRLDPAQVALDPNMLHSVTVALHACDGETGPRWRAWVTGMEQTLVARQKRNPGRCDHGSWDPPGAPLDWMYCTSLYALTLEAYYRHYRTLGP
jgi:hypothetical protein